jgi:hypothetical protein
MGRPLASHFKLSKKQCPSTEIWKRKCRMFLIPQGLEVWCLLWYAHGVRLFKELVLSADLCLTQDNHIGTPSSRFWGTSEASLIWSFNLVIVSPSWLHIQIQTWPEILMAESLLWPIQGSSGMAKQDAKVYGFEHNYRWVHCRTRGE